MGENASELRIERHLNSVWEFHALGLSNIETMEQHVFRVFDRDTIRKAGDCFGFVIGLCIAFHRKSWYDFDERQNVITHKLLMAYTIRYFPALGLKENNELNPTMRQASEAFLESFDNIKECLLRANNSTSILRVLSCQVTRAFLDRVSEYLVFHGAWCAIDSNDLAPIERALTMLYGLLDDDLEDGRQGWIDTNIALFRDALARYGGANRLDAFDERRRAEDMDEDDNLEE